MKTLMGAPSGNTNEMQGLANKCMEGYMSQLVNDMNDNNLPSPNGQN